MLEAHLQELSHPLNDYRVRAQRFLDAWKRGVTLIGTRFFEIKTSSAESATDKNQLRPNWDQVEESIGVLSRGETAFSFEINFSGNCTVINTLTGSLIFKSPICGMNPDLGLSKKKN